MVGSTKIGSNFALSGLLSIGAIWRQFEQKHPLSFRGYYKWINTKKIMSTLETNVQT
jgi:hypothetical protein